MTLLLKIFIIISFTLSASAMCIKKIEVQEKIIRNNIEALKITSGPEFSRNGEINQIIQNNLAELQEIKKLILIYKFALNNEKSTLSILFFEKLALFDISESKGKKVIIDTLQSTNFCQDQIITEAELFEEVISNN